MVHCYCFDISSTLLLYLFYVAMSCFGLVLDCKTKIAVEWILALRCLLCDPVLSYETSYDEQVSGVGPKEPRKVSRQH